MSNYHPGRDHSPKPADVEEMIQNGFIDWNQPEAKEIWQDEREEGL